jgi:hypothetical protein
LLVEFKGVPIEEIAKTMHHTCKTIQRYLSPDYSVEDGHYNARIPGKLAPYEAEVIKLRSEGMTYPNIHKIITEKGYKGSVASLRMFIQKERIRNEAHLSQQETCSDYQSKEYIQRRSLIQLIYKGLSDVKTITKTNSPRRSIPYYIREHLNACCQENPTPTTTDFIEIKMTDQASSSTSPFKPDVVIRRGAVSIEISNTATEELLNKVGGLLHA